MMIKKLKNFPYIICPHCNKKYNIWKNFIPVFMNSIFFNTITKKFENIIKNNPQSNNSILSCNDCFCESPIEIDLCKITNIDD